MGFDIKHKRDEEEGENELDDKEKMHYRDHKYFTNILNTIDVSKINLPILFNLSNKKS